MCPRIVTNEVFVCAKHFFFLTELTDNNEHFARLFTVVCRSQHLRKFRGILHCTSTPAKAVLFDTVQKNNKHAIRALNIEKKYQRDRTRIYALFVPKQVLICGYLESSW